MIFTETRLAGAFVIDIERHGDERGFFARIFCQHELAEHGLHAAVAQANVAYTIERGTVRGMHFQYPPAAETKIVRVTRGAVLDVIVDLRPESATYGGHVAVALDAVGHRALYVPRGFAHGYQTLEDGTELWYSTSAFYRPDLAAGIAYDDPRLGIGWPLPPVRVSAQDRAWPRLDELEPELFRRTDPTALERSSS